MQPGQASNTGGPPPPPTEKPKKVIPLSKQVTNKISSSSTKLTELMAWEAKASDNKALSLFTETKIHFVFLYIYIYSLLYVSGLMITKLFFSTYWNPPRGQLLCSRDSNPNLVLEGMPLQQQRLPWRVAMPRLWVSQIRTSRITQSCSNHLQRTWPMLKLLLLRSMAPLKASSWQLSLGLVPIWIQVIPTEN